MRKIYIVGKAKHYASWMQGELTSSLQDANLVVFTGGEDVTPNLYGEKKNEHTHNNPARDEYEIGIFKKAKELGKHIIGICRGSQFTCVMSGGRLVQHQLNPHYIHEIKTSDGSEILITSTHHQAMFPYGLPKEDYKVLGWTEGISPFHQNGEGKEISTEPFKEVEICHFPKTRVLGIQGHPESMNVDKNPKTFEYLRAILDAHLNDKL